VEDFYRLSKTFMGSVTI